MKTNNASLPDLVFGLTLLKYAQTAALTCMVCDAAQTAKTEIKYVWMQGRSLGKMLYIINRYFGMLSILVKVVVASYNLSSKSSTCVSFVLWWYIDFTMAVLLAEVILGLRVYAVYDRSRTIGIALVVLGIVEVAAAVCVEVLQHTASPLNTPTLALGFSQFDHFSGCYVVLSKRSFVVWIIPLSSEVILCLLILYKAWILHKSGEINSFLAKLIKDSIAYFVAMFLVLLAHCLFWFFGAQEQIALTAAGVILSSIASPWTIVVSSVLGSRLLLRMRKNHFRPAFESRTNDNSVWTTEYQASMALDVRLPSSYNSEPSTDQGLQV